MPAKTPTARTQTTSSEQRALVERALAFEREYHYAATTTEEHPLGRWSRDVEHPQMWTLNQLHVVGPHPGLTADALMAELDAGLADVRHRRAVVYDDATGREMADDFRAAEGWRVWPLLVMVLDREPPAPPPGVVREVDEQEMRALDRAILAEDEDIPDSDVAVVATGSAHMRSMIPGTRMFAGTRDGSDVCQTTLFTNGSIGQPEYVGTLRAHRGHGIAGATVGHAAREAQAAGCELVFIVCGAEVGPVPLYASLGFRAAGRFWSFTRPE